MNTESAVLISELFFEFMKVLKEFKGKNSKGTSCLIMHKRYYVQDF